MMEKSSGIAGSGTVLPVKLVSSKVTNMLFIPVHAKVPHRSGSECEAGVSGILKRASLD
jgi:hypothetical protein